MTSYLVYSTVALMWSRKNQCGNAFRRILTCSNYLVQSSVLSGVKTPFPCLFF